MVSTLRLLEPATQGDRHEGEVFSCAFTADGAYVLSGGWDGRLRLWEAATGAQLAVLVASPKPLSACAFSPNGKEWLAGNMEGLLSFWDGVSHQSLLNFVAHTRPISGIAYAPDGQSLATASWDRQIVLRKAGHEREGGRILAGHGDIVAGCRYAPDGRQLLSWSHDATVRLWDVETARELFVFQGHTDRVTAAAISPDGRLAVSVGRDGVVRVWDLAAQTEAGSADIGREGRACFFLLDGESLVTADALGRVLLLSLPNFDVQAQIDAPFKVMCGDLAPSGAQLVLGCEDGTVRFVAVDGVEDNLIVVSATQTYKPTASLFDRLMGKTKLTRTYQYRCPVCRASMETTTLPTAPVACKKCRRMLRVNSRETLLV
jgi:WD40 repeat protein